MKLRKIKVTVPKARRVTPRPTETIYREYEEREYARKKILFNLMKQGVKIPCIDGVQIDPDVKVGRGAVIFSNTILLGETVIGENCVIGPNTRVIDSIIGGGTKLDNVLCENSKVGENCDIGPFVHIRPNCSIKNNVHLGNFVEAKNSNIDSGTKVSHLTYVGDSDVGKNVNFGCGVVTVNYNGKEKFRTEIGDNCFIGCNTNLIAPVKVGDYGYTAAGSTITEDVPENALGIARAKQINKEDWVLKRKPYKKNP